MVKRWYRTAGWATGWMVAMLGATSAVLPGPLMSWADESAGGRVAESSPEGGAAVDAGREPSPRIPLAVARERAKLLHGVYAATLDVMHERYFHANRAVLPARALEDVFEEIEHQSQIETKWLAVSLKAMNTNNTAKSDFEKRAVKAIKQGESVWEEVGEGYYRRVGAIPLGNGCVSCHAGFGREPPSTPQFAGLVISLPIAEPPAAEPIR